MFSSHEKSKKENLQNPSSKQIIINFTSDGTKSDGVAEGLKYKFENKHAQPCPIIEKNDFLNNDKLIIPELKPQDEIQIYIVAHCEPGSNFLFCGDGNSTESDDIVPYDILAEKLINLIKLINLNENHNISINLVACAAGRAQEKSFQDSARRSFAEKFHAYLFSLTKNDIPVIARTHKTSVYPIMEKKWWKLCQQNEMAGRKTTLSLDLSWEESFNKSKRLDVSKQPGSKVIFSIDKEGYQIKQDCYSIAWKKEVSETLHILLSSSKSQSENMEGLLNSWLKEFDDLLPEAIFNCMKNEANNPNTALKEKCCCPRLFGSNYEYQKVCELIKKGERIFSSPFTIKEDMHLKKLI